MTQKSTIKIVCLLSLFFLLGNKGFSQTTKSITCPVVDDATISQYQKNSKLGKQSQLVCYPWWNGYRRRFLVKFDMSEIPDGAKIISAQIQLRMSRIAGSNTTVNAHLATKNWNENTVTWRNYANQFNRTVSSSRFLKWTGRRNTLETWNVTKDVQAMADGTIDNFGWLFKEPRMNSNAWFFHSKQGPQNFRPILVVRYEIPPKNRAPIIVTHTHKNISCLGEDDGEASVNARGGTGYGFSYNWTPEPTNGQGTNIASGLKPDVYEVTITDLGNSEQKVIEFEITEPVELTFTNQGQDASCATCADGVLDISASGGTSPFEYSIDAGQTYSQTYYYDNKLPGDYNVVVKDANGCTSAQTLKVGNSELRISNFSITAAGCGESNGGIDVTIQGGQPPYTFLWSNGSNQEDLSNVKSGIYMLNVTDDAGATLNSTYTVDVNLVWSFTKNVSVDNANNTFKSTTNSNWQSFAISEQFIPSGEYGKFDFYPPNNNKSFMIGLTSRKTYNEWPGREYIIAKYPGNIVTGDPIRLKKNRGGDIIPTGSVKSFPRLNDKVTVEKSDGEIRFYVNGFWTHTLSLTQEEDLRIIFKFGFGKSSFEQPHASFCKIKPPSSKQYFTIAKKLSEKIWHFNGKHLNFIFNEPYGIEENSLLNATLYNHKNEILVSSSNLDIKVNQGENKITVNCFSGYIRNGDENKIYYLHIKNSKGEESYLQLLIPNSINKCSTGDYLPDGTTITNTGNSIENSTNGGTIVTK